MSDVSPKSSQTAVDELPRMPPAPADLLRYLDLHFHSLHCQVGQLTAQLQAAHDKLTASEAARARVELELKRSQALAHQRDADTAAAASSLKKSLRQKELELIHAYHQINEMRKHTYRLKYDAGHPAGPRG